MTASPAYELPMFPLGAVLLPHAVTSLHIFEPRYRALAKHCTAANGEFGVVLIERGHEVGGGDARFTVGTAAHIVEAAELADGRWLLAAIGRRRISVVEWLPDAPYPLALVQDLDDVALGPDDVELLTAAERLVRRGLGYMAELGEPAPPLTVELDADPDVRAYELAAVAPIGPLDRQRLLEEADGRRRIERLIGLVEEENAVLAHRLAQG